MGDAHPALGPGARLPDTIEVRCATGEPSWLHALAQRAGHMLVARAAVSEGDLDAIAGAIRGREVGAVVQATIALTARPGGRRWRRTSRC